MNANLLPQEVLDAPVTLTIRQAITAIGHMTVAAAFAEMHDRNEMAVKISELSLEFAHAVKAANPNTKMDELIPLLEELTQ